MKYVLVLALAAFCYAGPVTYGGPNKTISISPDSIVISVGNGDKQITIRKDVASGEKKIDVEVTKEHVPIKKFQLNDDPSFSRETRSTKTTGKISQFDLLSGILKEFQGPIDKTLYDKLLSKLYKYVEKGELSNDLYQVFSNFEEIGETETSGDKTNFQVQEEAIRQIILSLANKQQNKEYTYAQNPLVWNRILKEQGQIPVYGGRDPQPNYVQSPLVWKEQNQLPIYEGQQFPVPVYQRQYQVPIYQRQQAEIPFYQQKVIPVFQNQQPSYQQQQDTPVFQNQQPFYQQQHDTPVFKNQQHFYQQQQDTPVFKNQQPFYQQQQDTPVFQNQQPFYQQQQDIPLFQNQQHFYQQQQDTPVFKNQQPLYQQQQGIPAFQNQQQVGRVALEGPQTLPFNQNGPGSVYGLLGANVRPSFVQQRQPLINSYGSYGQVTPSQYLSNYFNPIERQYQGYQIPEVYNQRYYGVEYPYGQSRPNTQVVY